MGEAAQWQCGQQRMLLRRKFNVHEIDATKLVRNYDIDGNKVLEPEELRLLLQDYNGGRPAKDDELWYIMRVADKNHDECISQGEVLFALRAWFAFNNMPKSVGAAFNKYQVGNHALPSMEAMQ